MAAVAYQKLPLQALLVVAFAALAYAQITTNTTIAVDRMAVGIADKIQSSGGDIVVVAGSAQLVGIDSATVDKIMVAYYSGLSTTLVPDGAEGIVVTSGPASNLATGLRTRITNDFGTGNPVEPFLTQVRDTAWLNGAGIKFRAIIPAGTISLSYAFCTSRTALSNFDTVTITIDGVPGSTSLARTNLAVTNDVINNFMTVDYRFGQAVPEGAVGSSFGLSTNITRCLPAQVATILLDESGEYELQFSASTQNSAPAVNWPQAYLLVGGANYPDNYDPAGAKFNDVDTFESIDTWCVIATGTSNNFFPGFRIESTMEGPDDKLCCRLKGRFNVGANTCDMRNCVGPATPFASFFKAINTLDNTDCYADCYFRSAYIGNDPVADLDPNLQEIYDGRFEDLELLTTTLTPATLKYGEPLRDASLTGTMLTAGGVDYLCTKAGFRFDASQALIGCDTVASGFICLSTAPDSRCYSNCFRRL